MGKTETAADLLAARDADFLAFCAQWQRDGRAFLGSADWFEERGMNGQARAWAWAAQESRHGFAPADGGVPKWGLGGLCPEYVHFDLWFGSKRFQKGWSWEFSSGPIYRCTLPVNWERYLMKRFDTFPAAVAWFLDRWAEVFGTEPVPAESTPADAAARGG